MADDDGLGKLIADLGRAAAMASPEAAAIVKHGAVNIKTDWRAGVEGFRHAPLFPSSVTYDMIETHAAQIGPDKGLPQGALGNLIEYGSVNNPGHNNGKDALDAEIPRTVKALGAMFVANVNGTAGIDAMLASDK